MTSARIALALLCIAPLAAKAQEGASLDAVAERYLGADTYCETGTWGMREDPKHGYTQQTYSRCAHSDGRFKYVEPSDGAQRTVDWSDGERYYRYFEAARYYREYDLADPHVLSLHENRSETFPAFLSQRFGWVDRRSASRADGSSHRQSFKPSGALSSSQFWVFERFNDPHERRAERIWVRSDDKAVVRFESLRDGEVLRFVEITSQQINPPLADADLSYRVPLLARFSLQNSPAVFVVALFIATALAGAFFWRWRFAHAAVEEVLRLRRRLWRIQLWSSAAVAILLATLAVLTLTEPGSGHPPGVFIVLALAVYCVAGFALAACFTAASYPVQRMSR